VRHPHGRDQAHADHIELQFGKQPGAQPGPCTAESQAALDQAVGKPGSAVHLQRECTLHADHGQQGVIRVQTAGERAVLAQTQGQREDAGQERGRPVERPAAQQCQTVPAAAQCQPLGRHRDVRQVGEQAGGGRGCTQNILGHEQQGELGVVAEAVVHGGAGRGQGQRWGCNRAGRRHVQPQLTH